MLYKLVIISNIQPDGWEWLLRWEMYPRAGESWFDVGDKRLHNCKDSAADIISSPLFPMHTCIVYNPKYNLYPACSPWLLYGHILRVSSDRAGSYRCPS